MQKLNCFVIYLRFLTIIFIFLLTLWRPTLTAQEVISLESDTTNLKSISTENIPILYHETLKKIMQVKNSLISDRENIFEKSRNDSILMIIDSLIAADANINSQDLTNRFLRNKINIWKNYQEKLSRQKTQLSNIINTLRENQSLLKDEKGLWVNTRESIDSVDIDSSLVSIADSVILNSNKVIDVIADKLNSFVPLFNNIISHDIKIENLIDQFENIIQKRQLTIFEKSHPSVFEIETYSASQNQLYNPFKLFFIAELDILFSYYKSNSVLFILYLLFIIFLVSLIYYVKSKLNNLKIIYETTFQKLFNKILQRPLSASLIIGIFGSFLFFSNRPLILVDLAILILAIALLDIFIRIIEKRFYKYLYVFTFLIFMRFINIAFAPELPVHRALLFIQSIIEVFTLFYLLADLKNIKNSDKIFFIRFIQSLVIIHLIASLVGFTANLTGHVNLAKILIDAIITNSLVALMLVISAVTIISLIQISIESSLSDKLNFIKNRRAYLKRMTEKIIVAVAVLIWVDSIIRILGLEKNAYDLLAKLFSDEISIGFATFTLGSILLFLFVIWLSIITGKVIRAVLDDDILTKVSLKKGVPRIISVMVQFTLVSLGVLLAVSSVGMPLDQLTIIFSAFSVGLGFGLQNIVNNFVSGVILLFERPIQIGDTVEIGNLIGNVKSMGIRSSNVRTFEGAEVIVPNGHLISNEVVNWTLSDKRRRIEIISGVAYGSDVHKVQKLLLSILKEHPDIINDPEPMVLFNDLGESSLDFRLLFWTDNFDEWIRIKSEVTFMIHDSLYKEGITIPFPQRDLHIKGDLGKLIFNNEKKEKE